MTLDDAKRYLSSMNIPLGAVAPPELAGNDAAFVERTNPPAYSEINGQRVQNKIKPGQSLDLILSLTKPVQPVVDTLPPPPQNP
jgi:hypothetical protein